MTSKANKRKRLLRTRENRSRALAGELTLTNPKLIERQAVHLANNAKKAADEAGERAGAIEVEEDGPLLVDDDAGEQELNLGDGGIGMGDVDIDMDDIAAGMDDIASGMDDIAGNEDNVAERDGQVEPSGDQHTIPDDTVAVPALLDSQHRLANSFTSSICQLIEESPTRDITPSEIVQRTQHIVATIRTTPKGREYALPILLEDIRLLKQKFETQDLFIKAPISTLSEQRWALNPAYPSFSPACMERVHRAFLDCPQQSATRAPYSVSYRLVIAVGRHSSTSDNYDLVERGLVKVFEQWRLHTHQPKYTYVTTVEALKQDGWSLEEPMWTILHLKRISSDVDYFDRRPLLNRARGSPDVARIWSLLGYLYQHLPQDDTIHYIQFVYLGLDGNSLSPQFWNNLWRAFPRFRFHQTASIDPSSINTPLSSVGEVKGQRWWAWFDSADLFGISARDARSEIMRLALYLIQQCKDDGNHAIDSGRLKASQGLGVVDTTRTKGLAALEPSDMEAQDSSAASSSNPHTPITTSASSHSPLDLSPPPPVTLPTEETVGKLATRHICPICHRELQRASALIAHSRTHTGKRPFRCVQAGCNHGFATQYALDKHVDLVHSRPMPMYKAGQNYLTQLRGGVSPGDRRT